MLVDELIFYLPSWGYLELGFLINESILQFELSNQALNKYVFFGELSQKICLKIPTGFLQHKSFGNDLFSSPRFQLIQGTFKPF